MLLILLTKLGLYKNGDAHNIYIDVFTFLCTRTHMHTCLNFHRQGFLFALFMKDLRQLAHVQKEF